MRNIWYLNDWAKYVSGLEKKPKKGLYIKFEKNVPIPVRGFCLDFIKWVRKNFEFPIKVNIYVKESYRVKAKDGEMVVGTFWRPSIYGTQTYIRLATGDYYELVKQRNEEQAMWMILLTLSHELTHYFQYINKISLTGLYEERQAEKYGDYILHQYDKFVFESQLYGEHYTVWLMSPIKKNTALCQDDMKIKLYFSKQIDKNIQKKCKDFVIWLNQEYFFTTKVNIHLMTTKCLFQDSKIDQGNVQYKMDDNFISECDVFVDIKGKELQDIFHNIVYLLTFYHQTLNQIKLTDIGKKRQSTKCATDVLKNYYL